MRSPFDSLNPQFYYLLLVYNGHETGLRLTNNARDKSMTKNPTGGRRSGTSSLMSKMTKLQLALLRSERETAMPQSLTFMNKTVAQAVDSRACEEAERLCSVL